jgi:prepilin-type N-terminal cleavage/methylation domain-containing protein
MSFITKNNPLNKNEKGFSLLEVIFAMAIITSGILSIMSLFSYNLKAETNNKNKLIATYLAQEGIEVVRQARDNIWFGTVVAPYGFLGKPEFGDKNYIIVPKQQNDLTKGWEVKENTILSRRNVYKKNENYYIQRDANGAGGLTETGFTRYLEINDNSEGGAAPGCDVASCVQIISHVSFNGVELAKITAYLYDDWY